MPNEFSVQIHDFLSAKRQHLLIRKSSGDITEERKSSGDITEEDFINGQLQEIDWLRDYLKEHFDLNDFKYYSE